MKTYENNPVNKWNGSTARLDGLAGGSLDSLLEQLAGSRRAPPAIGAQLPEIAPDKEAQETANPAPSGNLQTTSNR